MHFPVVSSLQVDRYALYPGRVGKAGFDESTEAALTVVVGANGLGKSTLLSMTFRLLTGPYDIPGAVGGSELGSAKLEATKINTTAAREFGRRVADGANDATATVAFALGGASFEITRGLATLKLMSWSDSGGVREPDERTLQTALTAASGLSSFEDWILALRYVSFYLDDRQVLFWDESAQSTLLRSLFLSPADAAEWVEREREVLRLDSEHRNVRNVLNGMKRRMGSQVAPSTKAHAELRNEFTALLVEDAELEVAEVDVVIRLARSDEERSKTNVARLQASRSLEDAQVEYDRLKILDLAAKFPSTAESALFVWSKLLSEAHCVVCENEVPSLRDEIAKRVALNHCSICNTPLMAADEATVVTPIVDAQIIKAVQALDRARDVSEKTAATYNRVAAEVDALRGSLGSIELQRAEKQARISTLRRVLPEDDEAFADSQRELRALDASLALYEQQLEVSVTRFRQHVAKTTAYILDKAAEVTSTFHTYAEGFLLGNGELTWHPKSRKMGQSSYRVPYPSYELQMAQGQGGLTVRDNAGDVSESQKEFIDLAFRMALIDVAGESGATILIDTPESSLDTVFSRRAAEVLGKYCATSANTRLVVASNLTDGRLVPELVGEVKGQQLRVEIINLLEIARPTRAMELLGTEYDEAFDRFVREISS